MSKTIKNFKQQERESQKGKIKFQRRILEDSEAAIAVEEFLYLQRDLGEGKQDNDTQSIQE